MDRINFCNAGSIQDLPIGRGQCMRVGDRRIAVFRETFGHAYVFVVDEAPERIPSLCSGIIEGDKIKLEGGHTVDLHTGRFDNSDIFVRGLNSWVENGFLLFTIGQIASGIV